MSIGPRSLAEQLNQHCQCLPVNIPNVHRWLERDLLADARCDDSLLRSHPHLLAAQPVFVDAAHLRSAHELIRAVAQISEREAYRNAALASAPRSALVDHGSAKPFLAFDFHFGAAGPQLIEINTNPGGAMVNASLLREQRDCCQEASGLLPSVEAVEHRLATLFEREWRAVRADAPLQRIAIVDEAPASQYLYPEFVLFKKLFEGRGIDAVIADPTELHFDGTTVQHRAGTVDLIYNRLTDFYLEQIAHRDLLEAHRTGSVVLTPTPRAHALYANKLNLVTLTDATRMVDLGASPNEIEILRRHIPRTLPVSARSGEEWWADRRSWFFKPSGGYAGRGAYRGDKLTRKAFDTVVGGTYVAQAIAPPAERHVLSGSSPLKWDLRIYTEGETPLLHAARVYDGQTTNFRTPGGGFASVLVT